MKKTVLYRSFLVLLLAVVFAFCFLKIQKIQEQRIGFLSFQLNDTAETVIIPDVDQILRKIEHPSVVFQKPLHNQISEAAKVLIEKEGFSFNKNVCRALMISYQEDEFNLVLKDAPSFLNLVEMLKVNFDIAARFEGEVFELGEFKMKVEDFGHYKLFSTSEFEIREGLDSIKVNSADYIRFNAQYPNGQRNILGHSSHFMISTAEKKLKGSPIFIEDLVSIVPSSFNSIEILGSNRFQEDAANLIENEQTDWLKWVDKSMMLVKKDSFTLLFARESIDKNLELLIDEARTMEDSVGLIDEFSIGKFSVKKVYGELNDDLNWGETQMKLNYFSAYNDYNVLSNSIAAMRWFLTEVQLGNLVGSNPEQMKEILSIIPSQLNELKLNATGTAYEGYSLSCVDRGIGVLAAFNGAVQSQTVDTLNSADEIVLKFQPNHLEIVEDDIPYLLAYNEQEIGAFHLLGEQLWSLNLSAPLAQEVQLVDFDNDGAHEIVLFQENQLDVVNASGQSLNGFPVHLNGKLDRGLAVNYDNKFVYRIFVSVGQQIRLFDEEGKLVEGWKFQGMNAPINSAIYHVLTEGKDIIAFKDASNEQFILNRRGESRLNTAANFQLTNETDFVVGGMESSLHKMGYENQYIKNYYIIDGTIDSVKIDRPIAPIKIHWTYNMGNPLLIAEEADRLVIIDQFGYFKSEVLKPQKYTDFVALLGDQDFGFVFADNSQNTIYLLNNFGKMMLSKSVSGSSVSVTHQGQLYTFSGTSVKAYKIN